MQRLQIVFALRHSDNYCASAMKSITKPTMENIPAMIQLDIFSLIPMLLKL